MSYGLFNWWWGEDEVVLDDKWENLYILNLEQLDEGDVGSYGYIFTSPNPLDYNPRNTPIFYDSRICSIVSLPLAENVGVNTLLKNHYGKEEWSWLVDNQPDIASLLRNEPCLIVSKLIPNQEILDILQITETEFKKLFAYWESYNWWVLKSPELNRKVGRILKKNSPEKYAKFASLSGGFIQ